MSEVSEEIQWRYALCLYGGTERTERRVWGDIAVLSEIANALSGKGSLDAQGCVILAEKTATRVEVTPLAVLGDENKAEYVRWRDTIPPCPFATGRSVGHRHYSGRATVVGATWCEEERAWRVHLSGILRDIDHYDQDDPNAGRWEWEYLLTPSEEPEA